MTSPRLATTYDWGRMYARQRGAKPTVPSITTVLGVMSDDLGWWEARCAADTAIERAVDLATVVTMPDGTEKTKQLRTAHRWLRESATRDKDAASVRGDLVHDYGEAWCLMQIGKATQADVDQHREACREGGVEEYLEHFHAWWDKWQPEVLQPEATVWNRTVGYAGTTDLICNFTVNGQKVTCVVDYKTKKALFKDEARTQRKSSDLRDYTGMQLAATAYAEEIWLPGEEAGGQDTWVPFPYKIDLGFAVAFAPDGFVVRQYRIHHPGTFETFKHLRYAWEFQRHGKELMSPILDGPDSAWIVDIPTQ